MFTRIKGTQDFLDLTLFNFIIDQIKKHLSIYHFTEIATPILEPTELFKRSLGMQTDVVSKEMFLIDTGGKEQSDMCLRPEATASVVRAFVENHIQQTPWKVFLHGPMFRHERPQKGRYRQFHQVNMEVIGSQSMRQDAQFIKMLDRFFHETLMLNNYAVLINFLGCFEDRKAYRLLLKDFLGSADAQGICSLCVDRKEKNIMRIFDCKNAQCQTIYRKAPFIANHLCELCNKEWQQLQEQLDLLSVSYSYYPTLVRGLDYYNKTVFEFTSANLGAQNAFCGGGRYDQLVGQVGAKQDQPSIGAAIGIERLMLLIDPVRDSLPIPQPLALHVVLPLALEQQSLALLVADELQAHSLCTDVLLEGDSVKSMMRKANKMGAAYCLLLGEDEQSSHEVMVKNMVTGEEERVAQSAVVAYLKGC